MTLVRANLINSISFNLEGIPVTNGLVNIERKNGFLVEGSLNTKLTSDTEKLSNFFSLFSDSEFLNKKIEISGNLLNQFKLNFDPTLKLKKYEYNLTGDMNESKIMFDKSLKVHFLKMKLKRFFLTIQN